MKNCKKCGYPLPPKGEFCPQCGKKIGMSGGVKALLIIFGALILLVEVLLIIGLSGNSEQAISDSTLAGGNSLEPPRDKFTHLRGGGEDSVTVMLYLVGSDLESDGGCATADLMEMLDADLGDKLNLVIQTGGALKWQNDLVESGVCQRYKVVDGGLAFLGDVGGRSMARTDTLSDFIRFSAENFPADRYQLIFWNHGGGTMGGFGYDEIYDEMLTLADIDRALDAAGVRFDLVGFDACLMATVETAVMLEPYADYLIASEELEPCEGWYYTGFLTSLGQNTSIDTVKLGSQIVDDFVSYYDWTTETTLSVTDLTQIASVNAKLNEFLNASERIMVESSAYKTFSNARAGARSYGEGGYEQIDIADYILETELDEGEELISAINSAVKYHGGTVTDSYGLAMYFPYEAPDYYEDVSGLLEEIGMGDDYTDFFDRFLSILAGGQISFGGQATSPLGEIVGNIGQEQQNFQACEWFEEETAESYDYGYGYDYNEKEITQKGDGYVLQMSDEEWEQIVGIELQVWYDDGEGYLDLGSDSFYEFDGDGDLLIDYDNLWVAINGQIVSFYTEAEEDLGGGSWYSYGYVPCFVNDEEKELVLCWNNEIEYGYVAGYRSVSVTGGHAAKGIIPLADGDAVDFIADYYTYNGDYEDWYYIGEPMVYGGVEWQVSYKDIGTNSCLVFYMLTDIYQNNYFTEALEFYTE